MTNTEFETILADTTKSIVGDISWSVDEDHSPSVEFRAEIQSDAGWPLFVRASYYPLINAITYALILKTEGRIYALDIGKDHHNPTCEQVGEVHKHRWTEQFKDKYAYDPVDISRESCDPLVIWKEFCLEAKLAHSGRLYPPPPIQKDFLQ